jgi:hypothetical protein
MCLLGEIVESASKKWVKMFLTVAENTVELVMLSMSWQWMSQAPSSRDGTMVWPKRPNMHWWLRYLCRLDRDWQIQKPRHAARLRLLMMAYILKVVNVMEVPATMMEIYLYLQILFNLFLNFVNAMVQILNMKEMLSMLLVMAAIKQSWTV